MWWSGHLWLGQDAWQCWWWYRWCPWFRDAGYEWVLTFLAFVLDHGYICGVSDVELFLNFCEARVQSSFVVFHFQVCNSDCQGSEGPWCMTVLMDGSRVAEHMSICPLAYETSHSIPLTVYVEEGIVLMDALY